MGEYGKQVIVVCILILIFFCLFGFYLCWLCKVFDWCVWLIFDWLCKGCSFNWDLYVVVGIWCLVFYLLVVLIGLYWFYEWYCNGLFKLFDDVFVGQQVQCGKLGGCGECLVDVVLLVVDYVVVWNSICQVGGDCLQVYNLCLLLVGGQLVIVFYCLIDVLYECVFNILILDLVNGQVKSDQCYSDCFFGSQLLVSVYVLYVGSYFGMVGCILMMFVSLVMLLFFIIGWLFYFDCWCKKCVVWVSCVDLGGSVGVSGEFWLIGYVSQSGFVE